MMKAVIIIIAIIASAILSSCSCTIEETKPFGTDFSSILKEAGVEPMTDDYVVQCYHQTVYVFNTNGTISHSLDSTFISIESFNEYGESVQNGFGYVFNTTDDAVEYFEYASGVYEPTLNEHTVWFERESGGQYKHDIIKMFEDDLFDSDSTYISKPFLSVTQENYEVPLHTIEKCK